MQDSLTIGTATVEKKSKKMLPKLNGEMLYAPHAYTPRARPISDENHGSGDVMHE